MKITKKIIGIGLALMLVASVAAMAVPAAAAPPGNSEWASQSKPGAAASVIYNGSEGTDFDQSPSTGRVYLVDRATDKLKTGTSGTVWSSLNNYATAGNTKPISVSVAPDNDQAIAVSDNAGFVQISNDQGVTWSTLPQIINASGATVNGSIANGSILEVAVGPARSGTLLGREYAVAISDGEPGNAVFPQAGTTNGGIYMIGATASWAAVATTAGANDFYKVAFSPGYVGDRVVVAAGVTAGGVVQYWVLNTSTNAALAGYPATVVAGVANSDAGGAAANVLSLDIALPIDFDPTTAPVSYVSVGTSGGPATDDVFRMNGTVATDLNGVTAQAVDSVGYSGTQTEGTLFIGYTNATPVTIVKRTAAPTAAAPTWVTTRNNPTGSTFINVKPNFDFASSNMVNAFTRGAESAWSKSEDGGVSFYQRSWVDNGVASDWVSVEDMAITADGSQFFFLTDDGADLHLWASPVPPSSMSQKRMYTNLGQGDGATTRASLYLNPDWAASPTIVIHNPIPATDALYISNNGGATWVNRVGPAALNINTLAMVDQNTIYATIGSNFYKTSNQGWTWEPAVAWNTSGTANDMQVTADGTIFISSTSVRKSTNGGASWASVGSYGTSGNNIIVLPDANYADNGIVYTGDNTTGQVKRLDVATNTYRNIFTPTTANTCLMLKQVDGTLYVVNGNQVARNTSPATSPAFSTLAAGDATWVFTGTKAVMDGNTVYVNGDSGATINPVFSNNLEDIYGYVDGVAGLKPVMTSPVSGVEVSVDPVTGRGVAVQLAWGSLGDDQGRINRYDIRVYDKAAGVLSATNCGNYVPTSSSSPSALTNAITATTATVAWPVMLPNTTYVVQVRGDRTVSGDFVTTSWSDPVEFTVQSGTQVTQTQAGPQVLGPQGGGTTGLNPGFAWAPVAGATKYQFIVATDAALTKTISGTPVELTQPSYQVMDLDYGTTYFWAVKVIEPTPGVQTISTFTTMDEPAAPVDGGGTPPVVEVPTQPVPDVIVNVPEQPAAGGAISTTAIWAVIGIGAVLIVAVLVLIVRTRRPV